MTTFLLRNWRSCSSVLLSCSLMVDTTFSNLRRHLCDMMLYILMPLFPSLTTCGSVSLGCVCSSHWVGLHFPLSRASHVILSLLSLPISTSEISDKVLDARQKQHTKSFFSSRLTFSLNCIQQKWNHPAQISQHGISPSSLNIIILLLLCTHITENIYCIQIFYLLNLLKFLNEYHRNI